MGFVFMRGPESDLREAPGVLGMQTFPDGGQYWRGPGIFFFFFLVPDLGSFV